MPTSFSYRVKKEICRNRPFYQHYKKALVYGLMLFGKHFSADSICLHTEHRAAAHLYADGISDLIRLSNSITVCEVKRDGKHSIYVATVDSLEDRSAILDYFVGWGAGNIPLEEAEYAPFLAGVFLACGTVCDPEKGYRAEFSVSEKSKAELMKLALSQCLAVPKIASRRNEYSVYYKESEYIEDLLTLIGAQKASLELMEVKIMKGVRNQVNRTTNCETANISKTVDAAMLQVKAIEQIKRSCGLEALDTDLQELAALRSENPDMSLRELGEALARPLSRSGVNHRLKRIMEFAQKLPG